MKRIILAAVVGGLIVFCWSALSHMALGLGEAGLRSLPEDEALLGAMSRSIPEDGLYYFPGLEMSRELSAEETAAWEARYRSGPTGLLLYHRVGGELFSPGLFITELLSTLLAAVVASLVASVASVSYARRVALVSLLGAFAWLSISVSYWNWYGFPSAFIAAEGVDQVIGWLLGGLVIAKLAPASSAR